LCGWETQENISYLLSAISREQQGVKREDISPRSPSTRLRTKSTYFGFWIEEQTDWGYYPFSGRYRKESAKEWL
jgi:hypothetical protein